MSATVLEQPIKVPVAITHSMLNMQRNMTQDINDKILLSFSHFEYFCHCSRDVIMLTRCAAIIFGGEGGFLSPQGKNVEGVQSHIVRQAKVPQLQF
jgi:hypothetical protein